MLVTTHKVFNFILFTACIIFSIQNLSYGQPENLSEQYITSVSERTPQVRDAIVAQTSVKVDNINVAHLKMVTSLDLRDKSISSLKSGDFSGLTALTNLNLSDNHLESLPHGIFTDLTALKTLRLDGNVIDPFPITVLLQKIAEGQFKALVPTGALFDIVLPINVVNGEITDGETTVVIPRGSVESRTLTVSRTVGAIDAVTVDIGRLPECPPGHSGCIISKSNSHPIEILPHINVAPKFSEGPITTRVVLDNMAVGMPLGKPLSAIDANGDPLTYTLTGVDVETFELDSERYIKAKVPLDNPNRSTYYVMITASDGILSSSLHVVINVVDVNDILEFPRFIPVSERTPQVRNAIISALPDVYTAEDVTLAHLTTITKLNLRSKNISKLKSGDFSGLIALNNLNLYNNNLIRLPDGIFNGLTALKTLRLGRNAVNQMILPIYLQQVDDHDYKVVIPNGAPFDMILPVTVTNGILNSSETHLTIPQGSTESKVFGVICPLGSPISPSVNLEIIPKLPRNHYGYTFALSTVYRRTPQVAEAIMEAIPGIDDLRYITDLHLVPITELRVDGKAIESLKPGDFAGMPLLKTLNLNNNMLINLPDDIFKGLMSLTHLYLNSNHLKSLPDTTFENLPLLRHLDLSDNEFTDLPPRFFDKVSNLRYFDLSSNELTSLSGNVFEGMTTLDHLHLNNNTVDPLPLLVTLEKVGDDQFKAVVPAGAPFTITLPITVENGNVTNGETVATIWTGAVESQSFTVTRTADTIDAVTAAIDTLPNPPELHTGYVLVNSISNSHPFEVISQINVPPVFIENDFTIRTIAENTAADVNIGTAITATDANKSNVLTYTLGGPDAAFFDIDEKTGQLKTKGALDYETKPTYTVIITVDDGYAASTSITVTINVPDVNEPPVFTEGSSATRSIAENTASGINIGNPIAATDPEGDALTYDLGGTDAEAFSIDSKTGQLKTKAALDYETKSTYTVIVNVSDGKGDNASITVTIKITDVNEPPMFTVGNSTTRSIAENTASGINIGNPITATDPESGTLTYGLGGTDADAFSIDNKTGQLKTKGVLDYETKPSYTVIITVDDGYAASTSITVTIKIIDVNEPPVFTEGNSTTRSIVENTASGINIGNPIAATDPESGTLTYGLGGTDADAFSIDSKTGQLMTKAALDYETKSTYTITITADDGKGGNASITVTINITDIYEQPVNNAPVFTEGNSTTRSITENTANGINIGSPIAATDADGDTLTYGLGGTDADADAFSIDSKTGQLMTKAALDYETKSTYTITITADDGKGGNASITVTINITDIYEQPVNYAPEFTEGSSTTRSVANNTASGINIGSPIGATDPDGDTLTYSLGGSDANAFSIDSKTGQLMTNAALNNGINSDYAVGQSQTKSTRASQSTNTYDVTITASDGKGGRASITVKINVSNVNELGANNVPVFTEGSITTRSITEDTGIGVEIGKPISATDADGDTLTYGIKVEDVDAVAFIIDSSTGQLKTRAVFDYETQSSYTITITADDGNGGSAYIHVTINITDIEPESERSANLPNRAPVFTEGSSSTRSIAENTASGINIGAPVAATDPDGDTITYALGGSDPDAFSFIIATGQLQTKAALDYETKSTYSVTVVALDGRHSTLIDVTVNVTNVNEYAPVFSDGSSTRRSILENAASGTNIGAPIAATDADGDTLTYRIGGADAAAFTLESRTGQLQTKADLSHATQSNYTLTITADDGKGSSASITVTVNIIKLLKNRPPVFTDGRSATRSIAENTASGTNIGAPISATDADGDTLRYSLSGTDASAFSINSSTGQLRTRAALDYETKSRYTFRVRATESQYRIPITVTVNVTNANEAPIFAEGSSTTRKISRVLSTGINVGAPFTATDPEGDTITYSLSGTHSSNFTLNANTGQLKLGTWSPAFVLASLKDETVYVTITASDSVKTNNINVSIKFTSPPVFTDGSSTSRSIAENTASGTNIGTPVTATDQEGEPITYSLGGTDAASFTLDNSTGQLQTSAALDYETKKNYAITITASDGYGRTSINVTVDITNVNEAPVFNSGYSTTLSVSIDAGQGANIGTPYTATDPDGDTISYNLANYQNLNIVIDKNTGQLKTGSNFNKGITVNAGDTFSLKFYAYANNQSSPIIDVTVNVIANNAPVFADGSSTPRSIAENTASGTNIGTAFTATDADGDTITYSLSGSDASAFSIDSSTGQLQTSAALDYETKKSYTLTIKATDVYGISTSISVTINVTNVNEVPVFSEGSSTTRVVDKKIGLDSEFGDPITATDPEGDNVVYSLWGTDSSYFTIVSNTGQMKTSASALLSSAGKESFTMKVLATDSNKTSTLNLTMNLTDFPVFSDGSSTTRSIAERTVSGVNIGSPISATHAEGDTLTYSLGGTNAAWFTLNSSTGQLQTLAVFDYETKTSYTITVTATDEDDNSKSITVTVNVTNVNEAPMFSDGSSTTRSIAENSVSNTNIGNPITATDPEGGDVTYSLDSTLPSTSIYYTNRKNEIDLRFKISKTTGQLRTSSINLDYETKNSYSMKVIASDGNSSSSITVTVNVTDVAEAPAVQQSPAKTTLLANYPNPFNPETWIPYQLSKSAKVTLTIYNVKGETVRHFALGQKAAGKYRSRSRAIHWDGKNEFGEKVATGVYFYQLTAGDFSATRRMLIIK